MEFNAADIFEGVVDRIPDREAVVLGSTRLTYRELDARTNKAANALKKLGIKKVDAGANGGKLEFVQDTPIDPFSIVQLVQSEPHRYRLPSANQLSFDEKMEKPETRFQKVERLLERLEEKHARATE